MVLLADIVKALELGWSLKMVQSFLEEESRQGDVCLHAYLFLTRSVNVLSIMSPFCCVCVEHRRIQVSDLFRFFHMLH